MQRREDLLSTVEGVAVLLFFLQAVRALFSVLFGVIYDALFEGPFTLAAAAIILAAFLAFLAPAGAPRREGPRWFSWAGAVVVFLARAALTPDHPPLRLAASLVAVAAGGLYVAATLPAQPRRGLHMLVLALAAEQVLRAAGDTFDPSLRQGWVWGQVALSLLLAAGAWWWRRSPEAAFLGPPGRFTAVGGLAFGAFLFVEMSLLALPNAVARWTGTDYTVAVPLVLLVTLLPLLPGVRALTPATEGRAAQIWGALCIALALGGLAAGYFLRGGLGLMGLLAAQGFLVAAQDRVTSPREGRNFSGLWLAVGLLAFVVLNYAYAFAFTYPYTIPAFRGAGLPILLVAALVASLPGLRPVPAEALEFPPRGRALAWAGAALVVGLSLVLALPPRPAWKEPPATLRVATYNIHYGYNERRNFTLEAIARTIEENGVDVVALQEVDAGRITSYSVDDALWLARRLGMQAVYQPTVEHLTGIGLLSRVPLVSVEGKLLTSQEEQTAVIGAQLRTAGGRVNAFAIWLGLTPEERATQIDEALAFIRGWEGPAVFGGDFNSTPGSPTYQRIAAEGFVDPFVALGLPDVPTSPAGAPKERVDFVWVRGLEPVRAWVPESLASDHRMVVVEVTV
ncbi:MAG: endonuclease/exonuclease/phosphatase family protein [Anaerolineae bacterium]|nr:endonuclease/exonuclease/phosphatase family protein [Anaerolineae bacterium]